MHLFLRIHVQCHLHIQLRGIPLNSSKLNQMYITLNKLLEEFFCTVKTNTKNPTEQLAQSLTSLSDDSKTE